MKEKSSFFKKLGLIIIYLLILLFVLNLIIFGIYYFSHPSGNLSFQLWKYFDSNIFKIVTVSLLFPIILFFIETRIKFAETILKNRIERENREKEEQKEKKRKRDEEMKKRRFEGISLTQDMWNKLFNLITDVIHLDINTNKKDKIEELKKGLANFMSFGNDVLVIWEPRFNLPNETNVNELYSKTKELYLVFMTTLYNSAEAVVYSIEKCDELECNDLQSSLRNIQQGIEGIAYESIILTLEDLTNLLELYESGINNGNKEKIQLKISKCLENLNKWVNEIKKIQKEHNIILEPIEDENVKSIREIVRKIYELKQEPSKNSIKKLKEYNIKFQDLFFKIPHQQLVNGTPILYSKEYIKHLADFLYFHWMRIYIERLAKWPK